VCLCRYAAAAKTFSRLLHVFNDSESDFSENCTISVPSVDKIYINSICAHVDAALYDEALILCDTVLSKCHLNMDASPQLVGMESDSFAQLATSRSRVKIYKTEALLQLSRADDALLCIDRSVSLTS